MRQKLIRELDGLYLQIGQLKRKAEWTAAERSALDAADKRAQQVEDELRRLHADERSRNQALIAACDPPPPLGDGSAPAGERWIDRRTGREIEVLRSGQRCARGGGEYDGLSFGGLLRSMILGPRSEIEKRALSEGTDSAGGFAVPEEVSRRIIDRLRAESVAFRAGAATVLMETETLRIARLATGPTAAWRMENSEITATDGTFEGVTFTARSLALLLKASRELMEDAPNLEAALEVEFARNLAAELDRIIFVGSGTPPEPRGVANFSGVGSVVMDAVGAPLTNATAYPKLLDALYEVVRDNAPMPTAAIMNPRTDVGFSKLLDSTSQPLRRPPMIESLPFLSTTAIPITDLTGASPETTNASRVIVGHFPHCLVGLRSALRIEVLKERFGEFLQYGFVAHLRADVQLEHPESFAVLSKITP